MNKREKLESLKYEVEQLEREIKHDSFDNLLKLPDFSDDDKCRIFDELYNDVLSIISDAVSKDYWDSESEYFAFETVMTRVLGEKVWDTINNLS